MSISDSAYSILLKNVSDCYYHDFVYEIYMRVFHVEKWKTDEVKQMTQQCCEILNDINAEYNLRNYYCFLCLLIMNKKTELAERIINDSKIVIKKEIVKAIREAIARNGCMK